jgi:hypothetical protein
MKYSLLLIFLFTCAAAHAQTTFLGLIQQVKIAPLPYSTVSEQSQRVSTDNDKSLSLHLADSTFVIKKLKGIVRTIVNPKGGTSFGDLDCTDGWSSPLDDIGTVAVEAVIKYPAAKTYLLHVEITEKDVSYINRGVLACVTSGGELTAWIYSDGSLCPNPHGSITRNFTIRKDHSIQITEEAYGDNTTTYEFNATYRVVANKFVLVKRKIIFGKV